MSTLLTATSRRAQHWGKISRLRGRVSSPSIVSESYPQVVSIVVSGTANKNFAFLVGNGWAGSAPSAPYPPERATSGIATCSVVGDTYRPVAKLSPALGWWTLPCLHGVPLSPHPSSSGQTINWVEEQANNFLKHCISVSVELPVIGDHLTLSWPNGNVISKTGDKWYTCVMQRPCSFNSFVPCCVK